MAKTLWSRRYGALLNVLIAVRHEAGLTQRELAERLGRPRSYVSKIETAERRVDPVECEEWAKACGKNPLELFARFLRR